MVTMKLVALVSGGKDSCFNIMHCVQNRHDVVALANLMPQENDELDSYMYQTVGHDVIHLYGEALGLPLFRRAIKGNSVCVDSDYKHSDDDEVEDLYELLKDVKDKIEIDGVSTGAILSNYQRVRVEHVCQRLGLQSIAYLWQRKQEQLLDEMIDANLNAILIKVATLGLDEKHLGKTLAEVRSHLLKMNSKYGINVCGEGGEYETMTLDCPLFIKRIVVEKSEVITHSNDAFAPVCYLKFRKVHLEEKENVDKNSSLFERLSTCNIRRPALLYSGKLSSECEQEPETIPETLCRNKMSHAPVALDTIHPRFDIDSGGKRGWITGIVCHKKENESVQHSAGLVLDKWKDIILQNNFKMTDVCSVNLFCASMDDFLKINNVYKNYFWANPPARLFVQAELLPNEHFRLDCLLHKDSNAKKDILHVQSISYWAPANIGPYSQAVKIREKSTITVYFSGSIGLNPANMEVISDGFQNEAKLALHHVEEVSKVVVPELHSSLSRVTGCITCYVTRPSMIKKIKSCISLSNDFFNEDSFLLNFVCVPRLPRNANVEWHVTVQLTETNEGENDGEGGCMMDEEVCTDLCSRSNSCYQRKGPFSSLSISQKDILHGKNNFSSDLTSLLKRFEKCHSIRCFCNNEYEKLFDSWDSRLSRIPVTSLQNGMCILLVGHD